MEYGIIGLLVLVAVLELILLLRAQKKETQTTQSVRQEVSSCVSSLGGILQQTMQESQQHQKERLDDLRQLLVSQEEAMKKEASSRQMELRQMLGIQFQNEEQRFSTFAQENRAELEKMRRTVEERMARIEEDTAKKLEEMRKTVDEKLQQTLEEKMNRSFRLVSERLEQVYQGLGEMQTLAAGVGDLKKVLTNVKTRGILGEIQLGAILAEILAPEQYETNVATKKGSKQVVEFAIKIPTQQGAFVYLPVDSKFPGDTYEALLAAYDTGNAEEVKQAVKRLRTVILQEAKDIQEKYIAPPQTTSFGILFLPFEGLYAEAVKAGLIEELQRDYHVNLAGPSTMAALLNSLQMGFRAMAIQKRTGEVWQVLGAVKTEFDSFAKVLEATKVRLDQAGGELEKLIGVRTRQIQRKLASVERLDETEAKALIEEEGE